MIALLLSKFGAWIIGAAGGAALLAVAYLTGGKAAKKGAALDAAHKQDKQEAKGRDAVAKEKRATVGSGNRDLVDRVRRRDGDWGGM